MIHQYMFFVLQRVNLAMLTQITNYLTLHSELGLPMGKYMYLYNVIGGE